MLTGAAMDSGLLWAGTRGDALPLEPPATSGATVASAAVLGPVPPGSDVGALDGSDRFIQIKGLLNK